MSLKKELEASIRKFFEFFDELNQNKSKLEQDVYNHFQEMRFQVVEHRERIKEKIDDIALEMIDKIKKHEESFSKSIKEHLTSLDENIKKLGGQGEIGPTKTFFRKIFKKKIFTIFSEKIQKTIF